MLKYKPKTLFQPSISVSRNHLCGLVIRVPDC
jgi:hypothetical protein